MSARRERLSDDVFGVETEEDTMSTTRSTEAFLLKVRRRQVIDSNGGSYTESIVSCEGKGHGVTPATCMAREEDSRGNGPLICVIPEAAEVGYSNEATFPARSAASRTPVCAAMTGDVVCVREDVSIEALAALVTERGISGVPVVNAEGFPIGVVSKTDVLRERRRGGTGPTMDGEPLEGTDQQRLDAGFHAEPAARRTVADIMMPLAFTVYEDSPLSRATALMAYEGVHRVPVVSDDGRVVGILSSLDVVRWLAQHDAGSSHEQCECQEIIRAQKNGPPSAH
jgi:CBS domain-containing protein